MLRNKAYSFINIAGLSVGIACCLMLALYIQDEFSYDKHHKDGDHIYRMTTRFDQEAKTIFMASTSAPIAWGIKDEIPEFEKVARMVNPPGVAQNLIRYENNQFYESEGFIADSTIFEILTYEFVEGNPKKALVEANSVVVTTTLAKKLFGNESALNKVINIDQGGAVADYKVTGVFKEGVHKSHVEPNFFVSMTSSGGWAEYLRSTDVVDEWGGQNFIISYVKLKPDYEINEVIKKVNIAFMKHGADDMKALGFKKELGLHPIKDIYLYSAFGEESPRIVYIYVIASIATFILLIACINFMNLSTAKATKRASEVGLRKTLGANRTSLVGQFLGEAMVIVVVAIMISMVIVQLMLPGFNAITGKAINLQTENIYFIALALAVITIITGAIAGSYPAFYLSSFQPAKVLKGKSSLQSSNSLLRRSLVVFQFVIAITLVCGMIVITKQLNYMQEKDLGFNADHKIILPLRTASAQNNYAPIRNEVSKLAAVNAVSATGYLPGSPIFTDFSVYTQGSSMDNATRIRRNWVEPNYLDMLDIIVVAGNNFSEQRDSTSGSKVIVNVQAVKELGLTPETAVGEVLYSEWQGTRSEFRIIGVMEDFHQVTLKEGIYPIMFRVPEAPNHSFIIVDTKAQNFSETLAGVEKVWKSVNPDTPFEYTFLDENIAKQYEEDRKVSKVITSFSIIAMIICCLGLYGLSTYMAERRFKEIGIRKVMGATVQQIMSMMSAEFVKLVLIAFVISVPLAWYGINKWLEGFEYKTTPGVEVFVYSGLGALVIALLTVSFESIRAASGNPVNALRNE